MQCARLLARPVVRSLAGRLAQRGPARVFATAMTVPQEAKQDGLQTLEGLVIDTNFTRQAR